MKYIKANMSFYDRLVFLFTDLISEELLPKKVVEKEIVKETVKEIYINKSEPVPVNHVTKEEPIPIKTSIPYFDFSEDEVKSNLS